MKKIISILLFLVILGVTLPNPALAFWAEMVDAIVVAASGILITVTTPFLVLSQALLDWVISSDFISVSFTGQDNLIVQEGWGIVRNFTNMFIILGFVLIALATILRIKEYEAQKLLPLLIGIALLINFTPVICGFIIDASNVAMNYFLTAGTLDKGIVDTIATQTEALKDIEDASEKLALAIVYACFNIIAAVIFLLFAFLFAVRYVALWILIILSPIAFFCYVLPQTKTVWSMWWKQFIQWCIIGIPAAFFIYLSNITIREMKNFTSAPTGELSIFTSLFFYTIPLIFLIIGFFVSLQTSAMGADKAIGFAKTGIAKGGKWAGRKVGDTAIVKGTKEKFQRRIAEPLKPRMPGERGKIAAQAEFQKKREEGVTKEMSRLENRSVEDRQKFAKTPTEKLAVVRLAVKEDHLDDWDRKQMDIVKVYGTKKDLIDASKKRPDWAADLEPEKVEKVKTEQGVKADEAKEIVIRKKVQGRQPVKLRQETQAEAFKSRDVVFSMSEDQIKEMTNKGSGKQKIAIYKTFCKEMEETTGQIYDAESIKEIMDSIKKNRSHTVKEIDRLKATGNAEDLIKAEQIKQINNAIADRKF